MPASKIAIVYSKALGTVRWWVVPDRDEELDQSWNQPGQGEACIVVPMERYTLATVQDLVNEATGRNARQGVDDRFAVVDKLGEVIAWTCDDPACHPDMSIHPYAGHRLIRHTEAGPGWQFKSGRFIAPPEE